MSGDSGSGRTLSPLFTWRSAVVESDLPPTSRHVALTLSLHMNERGGSCFPSVDTLANETGLSSRTVRTAVGNLERTGWLRVRRGGGRRRSNVYTATVPPDPEDPQPSRPESRPPSGPGNPAGETLKEKPGNCFSETERAKPGNSFPLGRKEDDIENTPSVCATPTGLHTRQNSREASSRESRSTQLALTPRETEPPRVQNHSSKQRELFATLCHSANWDTKNLPTETRGLAGKAASIANHAGWDSERFADVVRIVIEGCGYAPTDRTARRQLCQLLVTITEATPDIDATTVRGAMMAARRTRGKQQAPTVPLGVVEQRWSELVVLAERHGLRTDELPAGSWGPTRVYGRLRAQSHQRGDRGEVDCG